MDALTAVWPKLVQEVAAHWKISTAEAEGQMLSVVRHAIYDPALALAISASGLLQMTVGSDDAIRGWIDACFDTARQWSDNYRLLEHRCTQQSETMLDICGCVLTRLVSLFDQSAALHDEGQRLVAQLPPAEADETYEMLLRALARLARIEAETSQGEIAWLWEYVRTKAS